MAIDALNFQGTIIDNNWTLFLDRDGVINNRIPGAYISRYQDLEFKEGVIEALQKAREIFARIIIVTNQQGIDKGLLEEDDLFVVHDYMLEILEENNIMIDEIYYCPALASEECSCRKPNPGMGLEAKLDFPEIVFGKSVMIGDSISDMGFADALGMKKILVLGKEEEAELQKNIKVDLRVDNLSEINFATFL